jgi:hypothetical protein
MKFFKALLLTLGMVYSAISSAIPVTGFTDVTNNLDGTFTFTFDSYSGNPILGGTDGLIFSGFGIDLTVTGTDLTGTGIGEVVQDGLPDGGLGILGGSDSRINIVSGSAEREQINFAFNRSVDLVFLTVNGLGSSDGHTDEANGRIAFVAPSSIASGRVTLSTSADQFDGIADTIFDGDIAAQFQSAGQDFFSGIDTMFIRANNPEGWQGYVESLTVRLNPVPEPSIIALFGLGFISMVVTRARVGKLGQ